MEKSVVKSVRRVWRRVRGECGEESDESLEESVRRV